MRLCKDCKHFALNAEWQTPPFNSKHAICGKTSMVDGNDGIECHERRKKFFNACGPKAKQWEAK